MCFCESYQNADEEAKADKLNEKNIHESEKQQSRIEKSRDKKNAQSNLCKVACFELQAVLPTPCGEISSFYYKSKLSTYNLSFFNMGSGTGHCYLWHEGLARRGSNEVGSCILHFLENNFAGEGNVILYSDNCAGQNKNKYIASVYSYAVSKYNFSSITHKFFIVGHSQNEVDSIHSVIEKEKKGSAIRSHIRT